MKKIIAYVFLIAAFSCQSLDEAPTGIATPSTFYTTIEQCEAALAGAMAPLWGWYVSPATERVVGSAPTSAMTISSRAVTW